MINNYITGGQIFLHKMRMLRQVWAKTMFVSFLLSLLIGGYLSYDRIIALDYPAGFSLIQAHIVNSFDGALGNKKSTKLSASTSEGIYSKSISANSVIKNSLFQKKYNEIIACVTEVCILILGIMAVLFALIIFFWSGFGKSAKAKDMIKGGKVLNSSEVSKALKKLGKASHFKVGGMNLVKNQETSHILVTGKTGSGKTSCMNELLPQIREKNQPAGQKHRLLTD